MDEAEHDAQIWAGHRLREELFATVSHELRTPLTSIIGYAELLADLPEEHLSATARRLVAVIGRNADRELRLVNDLLTRTWLDDDPAALVKEPVDLADVARTVVADARVRSGSDDVTLTFEQQANASVLGDPDRLTQVVDNLVSNALKFTPPGGRVEVRVCASGGMSILEVADTGIGVSVQDRERLFERLYRAPEAVDHHIQGAGLGLSIVKAIVTAHEGWIDVESSPGQGSTFRVVLPARRAQKSRLSASSRPRSAS